MAVVTQRPEVEEPGAGETPPPSPPTKRGILRYNSPLTQVTLVGLVCFCCPGMFNALTGLGGGGQLDHATVDNANTVLYACFAVLGVPGGAAYNLLGPRATLLLGALAYPIYAASFLYHNHHQGHGSAGEVVPVAAGGLLGVGAALLWAAQGAVVTSYPPPSRHGSYISLFWCLYNLGGVLGGLFPFAFNYRRGGGGGGGDAPARSVNDGTYIAFMAFMLLGAVLALLVLPPSKVVRDDGSKAARFAYSSLRAEAVEVVRLFVDWKMLLVLPAAWDSNFFYTYQFNNVNGVLFTLRTQGLNNVFYWGARMLGSVGIGRLLDFGFFPGSHRRSRRKQRGLVGIAVVAALGTGVWGGGLANQLRYRDGEWAEDLIDFKDGRRYAGPFLLFFSYGLLDAMFQSLVYWIIGALADESQVTSRYIGFYNAVQSAGAAVAWQIDRHKTPLITQLVVNWGLMTVSYPLLVLLVLFAVKDEDEWTIMQT